MCFKQLLAERFHLEEVVGLVRLLDLHGRVQRALAVVGEIAFLLELLAALAVGAGVLLLDDQALVEDALLHLRDGRLVAVTAGAHEIVELDAELLEDIAEFLAAHVEIVGHRHAEGLGRFLVLLAVLVDAGGQHHLVPQRLDGSASGCRP
jgi:hypothetical protein